MRMTSSEAAAQTSGIQSNAFQLTNSAKIIDIVINKMYMNKPGAVIRELASNAWDAHVEAGNTETPFEIELPTWLSKTFSIRDFGLGIPHGKFEMIYTNIGGSTKDNTNDLIGGFGLGSKTPFTMVDQFTVENIHEGEKATWLCYKSEGAPMVSLLSQVPTDEPSGLKVSFTFKDNEVDNFQKQLEKQLRFFPVKPKVTGGERKVQWQELPDGWETQDYFYTKHVGYHVKHSVVMGNVNYELDPSQLDNAKSSLFSKELIIKCDIGDVDIPPSRENLEYTPKTKDYLNKRLAEIQKKYRDEFFESLKDVKYFHELMLKCRDANTRILGTPEVEFEGKKYHWGDLCTIWYPVGNLNYSVKEVDRSYAQCFRGAVLRVTNMNQYEWYVNDLGKGGRTHVNNNAAKFNGLIRVLDVGVCSKDTLETEVKLAEKTIENVLGKKAKRLSSLIGMPVKGASSPRKKVAGMFVLSKAADKDFNCLEEQSTVPTEGYFLKLHGQTVDNSHFVNRLGTLHSLNILDKPLYLVRSRAMKDTGNLKELTKADIVKHVPEITKKYKRIMYYRESKDFVRQSDYSRLSKIKWNDENITRYLKYCKRIEKLTILQGKHDYQKFLRIFGILPETKVNLKIKEYYDKHLSKYDELFTVFRGLWSPQEGYNAINNYIGKQNG